MAIRAVKEDDFYPMRGYRYTAEGLHDGGVPIPDSKALKEFMDGPARTGIRRKREVIITDCWDNCLFESKDGKILWTGEGGKGER